jgi:hypothetical protein
MPNSQSSRSRNLSRYRDFVSILMDAGKSQKDIADFVGVTKGAIYHLLNHA